MSTMTLYHYTCREHLSSILATAKLKLTESNIGSANPHLKPFGEHVGPDVVWLTEDPSVLRGHGLDLGPVKKLAIRFTVAVDAIHWPTFAAVHGINRRWYRDLNRSAGNTATKWWVCPNEIPESAWIEIYDMERRCTLFLKEKPEVAA